jgi:hypothetical protein
LLSRSRSLLERLRRRISAARRKRKSLKEAQKAQKCVLVFPFETFVPFCG